MLAQSVEVAAATHTRAGNDYLTGITRPEDVCQKPNANVFAGRVSNAEIGMSNMINWAVGLYPCNIPPNLRPSSFAMPFQYTF